MRIPSFLLFLLISLAALSQSPRIDFAKLEETPDRKQITEAYMQHVQKTFETQSVFVLDHLYVKNEFAFLAGKIRDRDGKDIDFARFDPARQKGLLPMKGPETRALLKRKGEGWAVLTWLVSADDAACACWWAEYNAPKELFDYTDYCR